MQFGFRAGHSTVHPLTLLIDNITKALEDKKHSIAIFCDLSKAFDCVNHKLLLKKLKGVGLGVGAVEWFRSYLADRKQTVCIGESLSSESLIKLGVPQGSILGPLLFIIYVNDLPNTSLLTTLLFADDTTLLASNDNFNVLLDFVQQEFRKVCEFFRSHGLAMNASKSNFMIFSNNPEIRNLKVNLYVDNNNCNQNDPLLKSPLTQVSPQSPSPYIKFLGVLIDPDLTFKHHITHLSNNISKGLYFIRSARNYLSPFCLQSLYYTLIHSHLTYAPQIWGCSSPTLLKPLINKQKMAVRLITNSKYNSHSEPIFKKLNILPLEKLILYFNVKFMHEFNYKFLPVIFRDYWLTNRDVRLINNNDRELRNDSELLVPYCRLSNSRKFPYYNLPVIWNSFENNPLIIIRDRNKFKLKLKEFLLSTLNSSEICGRLFCHACSNLNI